MPYPQNDDDFIEVAIERVEASGEKWVIIHQGGWWLYCGDACPVKPEVGMLARMYPKDNIGRRIRGLFVDGHECWYRSEIEDKEHQESQLYGIDAKDWLRRWDAGETCWTIKMGGLSPSYEQCIHITCAEILRWFIGNNADVTLWEDADRQRAVFDRMETAVMEVPIIKKLGLSGAQWGAACNLAARLYRHGPRAVMADTLVKDRHIQVSREFPSY